ncbi:MAG TPA: aminoglycoside phosphotransferase family protein [Ktedonobacteraceae bacterium]|nr:aminoglycoside phosphotransferase family protein [Ktedonobacteraceae bacterium]
MSNVSRTADTVRRSVGPWSQASHAVLEYLERVGFDGAPRFLGIDAQGREVLSYIPGQTISEANRPEVSPARLKSAARLLRRLHDALEGFHLPEGVTWHPRYHPHPEDGPVWVCHMDAHPANTIFQGDQAVAFIDWDMVGPVPRAWDVAWSAYSYAPLADDEVCRRMGWQTPPDRMGRLRLFCDAYGLAAAERGRLPDLVIRLARQQIADIDRAAKEGVESARFLVEDVGYPRLVRWRIRWVRDHRDELVWALQREEPIRPKDQETGPVNT